MAFTPTYAPQNVMTGVAALYIQDYVLATPAALPADTIDLGGVWTAPWVPAGATLEGVSITLSREVNPIMIEEQVTQVDERTTSVGFSVSVTLSEDTLDTMRIAYGGGTITTVAPTVTVRGTKTLVISSDSQYFALGIEGQAPPRATLPTPWRRILIPKVSSVAEVETAYRRSDQQRVYACTFNALVAPELCPIKEYNAPTGP
jgi:hypothetical protein